MSYSSLMLNAAKILFVLAVVLFVGTPLVAIFAASQVSAPAAMLAGLAGAFSSAAIPFLGAAIVWRLDIWLFKREAAE
ncbi:hypothetical protein [Tsuneonella amylolytica]|uniref:hypothetical protein n=1 Tax=Tsuneonella amylolytica TaxID=2338327 RepID=UPI000EAA5915|nr:hypothetical protein [Tsuneonella amylolytica]